MEKLATENLFLLEFLVDNLDMQGKCDCDSPPGELCVSFQFLDNAPLDVCEADFTPNRKYGDRGQENVKSGKSCLFSLTPEQVQQAFEVFDVFVSVFKKMQPGWLPEKMNVGNALISISNLFVELIQGVEATNGENPSAKTLKDTFDVSDDSGSNVGKIAIYIRMSCFGKLIVTQFQMNLEDKSVLFKDKEGQSLYRYKKAKKGNQIEEGGRGNPNCPNTPCYGDQMGQPQQQQQQQQFYPQMPSQPYINSGCPMKSCFDDPIFAQQLQQSGMFPNQMQSQNVFPMAQGQMQSTIFPPPPPGLLPCSECNLNMMQNQNPQQNPQMMMQMAPCNECGQFPSNPMFGSPFQQQAQISSPCVECGALVGLSPPCVQQSGQQVAQPSQPSDPPGNYQEIGAKMGQNALTIRVHKDKNKIEQVDGNSLNNASTGSCCCGPDGPSKKPKRPTTCEVIPVPQGCATQQQQPQSFALRPGVQQGDRNIPFSFRMSGQGAPPTGPGGGNVIINPPVCTKKDGTQLTEISDPDKEVFVLRIGKKSEGVQRKQNLELELCTPKGPDLKPRPKKESRDCQYDPKDCEGGGKKKKGKKGKKDKKGKGKKGKGKGKKGKGKGSKKGGKKGKKK